MRDDFINEFYDKMNGVNLEVYGILDSSKNIHTLGTDSKIIGRIFEMITQPILEDISKSHGLILKTPKAQNTYPDFILMHDENSKNKIAIDIKTTYVKPSEPNIKFTLGSFGSYMRNNTKNIAYPYTDFSKHYVIGFVYERKDDAQASKVFSLENIDKIVFPYTDVKYFMQEKYKIAGDKPGSGNTENIGSLTSKMFSDFTEGKGPFATLGQDVFDLYWKYYPKYRSSNKPFTSLAEFIKWLPYNKDVELLHPFDIKKVLSVINDYEEKMFHFSDDDPSYGVEQAADIKHDYS